MKNILFVAIIAILGACSHNIATEWECQDFENDISDSKDIKKIFNSDTLAVECLGITYYHRTLSKSRKAFNFTVNDKLYVAVIIEEDQVFQAKEIGLHHIEALLKYPKYERGNMSFLKKNIIAGRIVYYDYNLVFTGINNSFDKYYDRIIWYESTKHYETEKKLKKLQKKLDKKNKKDP